MVTTPVSVDVQAVFTALEKWINQKPGLDWRNYGADANGRAAYRSELRDIGKDKTRAMKALDEARGLEPKPELLADAFKRAFSGRLELNLKQKQYTAATCPGRPCSSVCDHMGSPTIELEYCTGQYWPTEYRKAAASVLETYIATWRQAYAAEHPQEFTYKTMDDVEAANRSIGGHWFDASTMRFFKTKIESGLVAGHRFISSEKGPDEVRRYTVRDAKPDGSIDTVGEFQGYKTRDAARAAILK